MRRMAPKPRASPRSQSSRKRKSSATLGSSAGSVFGSAATPSRILATADQPPFGLNVSAASDIRALIGAMLCSASLIEAAFSLPDSVIIESSSPRA